MKRIFYVFFFLLILCFFFPFNIFAAEKTVYVDQSSGSDEYNGSSSAPFNSLTKALNTLGENDDLTIILNNRYTLNTEEKIIFSGPLKENGTPRVTIKPASSGYFSIEGVENSEVTFKNIIFNGEQNNDRSNPIFIVNSGSLIFDNVRIQNINVSTQDGAFARIDGGTLQMRNGCAVSDCQSRNGVYHVGPKGTLTVAGDESHSISFANCQSTFGGAIYNLGSLTVDHATFQNNVADNNGGAIYNKGLATISNTVFKNKNFPSYKNNALNGGAIYNEASNAYKESKIELSHCQFTNNSAGYYGGAINNHGTFNGTDLTFESNDSQKGSAIYAASNILTLNNVKQEKSVVTLIDCQTAEGQSILTDSNKVTLCGGTYNGPIQLGTNASYMAVKKSDNSQDTVIYDLQLGNGQFIKYDGGFTEKCCVIFSKPKEFISKTEQIIRGQFNEEAEINSFHFNNENYHLEHYNASNYDLKLVEKSPNPNILKPAINYGEETLCFDNADCPVQWKTNDEGSQWQSCPSSMFLSDFGWDGSKAVEIILRCAATYDFKPGDEVSFTIPARPDAPTGLSAQDETAYGAANGSISGLSNDMEYRTVSDDETTIGEWTDVSGSAHFDVSGGTMNNLAPGKYQFRIKVGSDFFASFPSETLEIKQGPQPLNPTLDLTMQINYADETVSFDNADSAIEWKTSGTSSQWQSCSNSMPLTSFDWDGSKAVDVIVHYAATDTLNPNDEVSFTIPARLGAPTGFSVKDETSYGAGNGSIEGVTSNMVYRTVSNDGQAFGTWTDVSASDNFDPTNGKLSCLAPGKYQFRKKASNDAFASLPSDILEIKEGPRPVKPAVEPSPAPRGQINYVDESIVITKNMCYRASDGTWFPCVDNMPLEAFGWDGSAAVIVTLRDKYGRESILTIPPRAPAIEDSVLSVVDETVFGEGGEITGVTESMEYRVVSLITTESESEVWTDCAVSPHFDKATGTLKNMPAGNYAFRTKASNDTFSGVPVTLTVHAAKRPIPGIAYQVHGKNYGWSQGEKSAGETAGTTGKSLRLEAIRLRLLKDDMPGQNIGIAYRVHMANIGWSDFTEDGEIAGTTGECRRIEAIEATLTGDDAQNYNLWYRVHVKDIGWMPWVKNGQTAGTTGQAKRIEAVEIKILAADDNPD